MAKSDAFEKAARVKNPPHPTMGPIGKDASYGHNRRLRVRTRDPIVTTDGGGGGVTPPRPPGGGGPPEENP